MPTAKVLTSPVLRQFAVMSGSSIEVSTKLGPQTLVRATFDQNEFPSEEELQTSFLNTLVRKACPGALNILEASALKCLEDQAAAVRKVIQATRSMTAN
jgi:hypothetical protein